ncbi:tripartite tricarboxylate transporter substrate binding protein [Pseudorhodoferax sp. Leaf267]|uniref:tripartite tricarboxylate transporter substrate binding protein n=1 Tax=Pseudorhodoferax sp. Leaf267 TaxID=1736316 RepID=UPI0006FA2B4E|nr:tripartite tricarboxylate transporter substrate binding protein [Pseudorhodoferax sp. Leaf267]KQP13702.1 LacI family transcriptional regulator [Pseudorhodoferax sp. Leaf267]
MHPHALRPLRTLRALAGFVLAGSLLVGGAAPASTFPNKPVRIVVPFAPGGGTDLIARTLGQEMSKDLGQPVIIDNKPGAGTIIGTDAIAKAAPDGYSLVMASFAHAVNPSLQSKLPFDNAKAFAPVMLVGRGPNVLVVRPASPFKTVADLLAAAKANPGKLTYASQGAGTSAHLAGEMFDNLAKVKTLHIPYRGAGPAMTDLMGGQVEMFFGTAAAVAPFVERGQLRAIAVTSAEPSAAFKGVPTVGATIPGYAVESWYGLYAPAGTPQDVIARLNAAARKAARAPDFARKVEQEGLNISAGNPAELDTYVRAEEARWARIVKENGIKAD